MAQGTPVCGCHWFGGQAFLLLHVHLVVLLVDCFLAPWTSFIVLAVGALSHQMSSQCTNLNSLSALATNNEHRAGVKVMHIFIVLFSETLVNSLAELAYMVFAYLIWLLIRPFLRNLNEFVACVRKLLLLSIISWVRLLWLLSLNWLFIIALRLFHVATFLKLFFDGFDDGRP